MLASLKLLTTPWVVIRPIELFPSPVNQSAPSGPAVIPDGQPLLAMVYVLITPLGRDPPDRASAPLVNHSAPSGPAAMPKRGARRSRARHSL